MRLKWWEGTGCADTRVIEFQAEVRENHEAGMNIYSQKHALKSSIIETWWIKEIIHQWGQREGQTIDRLSGLCQGVSILVCVQWKAYHDLSCVLQVVYYWTGRIFSRLTRAEAKESPRKIFWKNEKERLTVQMEINGYFPAYKINFIEVQVTYKKYTHLKFNEFWYIYVISATFLRERNQEIRKSFG